MDKKLKNVNKTIELWFFERYSLITTAMCAYKFSWFNALVTIPVAVTKYPIIKTNAKIHFIPLYCLEYQISQIKGFGNVIASPLVSPCADISNANAVGVRITK